MTTTITVCETCKCAGWDAETAAKTDGEALAELVENAAANAPDVTVRRHACLMGCDFACNIAIQADDKLNYVLGTFTPTQEDAQGIVDYATLHAASEKGQVPYREWPQAIKGHFRARLPVLDKD
jgi:predicted metal-binding protein